MYWRSSTDGWFSTKSSVQMIQKDKGHSKSEVKWIWDLDCTPKVKHFVWRLSKNGLPTKEKLQQRRIAVPMQCVFCNHHTENTAHLFLECSVVRDTLQRVNENFLKHSISISGINRDEKTILNILKDKLGMQQMSKLAVAWWSVWYFRNQIIFNNNTTCDATNIAEFIN